MDEKEVFKLEDCFFNSITCSEISLTFKENERVMLVFSGDQALNVFLDAVYGFALPESGKLYFEDKEYKYSGDFLKKIRWKFALISTEGNLINNLDVFENIKLPLLGMGTLKKKDIQEITENLVRKLGLQDILDRLPHLLSDFEKVRVNIARGLGMGASVFIFDNLFEKLGDKTSHTFFKEILKELPLTLALSKSERGLEFCDRIVILDEEGIIYNGSTRNFTRSRSKKNE